MGVSTHMNITEKGYVKAVTSANTLKVGESTIIRCSKIGSYCGYAMDSITRTSIKVIMRDTI